MSYSVTVTRKGEAPRTLTGIEKVEVEVEVPPTDIEILEEAARLVRGFTKGKVERGHAEEISDRLLNIRPFTPLA